MIFNNGGDFKGLENRIGYPLGEGVAENAVRRLERGGDFPLFSIPYYLYNGESVSTTLVYSA